MKYITSTEDNKSIIYTTTRNMVNAKIKSIKEEFWEGSTDDMENDLYGDQKKVRILEKKTKNYRNKLVINNNITSIEEWKKYVSDLYHYITLC